MWHFSHFLKIIRKKRKKYTREKRIKLQIGPYPYPSNLLLMGSRQVRARTRRLTKCPRSYRNMLPYVAGTFHNILYLNGSELSRRPIPR